MPRLEFRGKGTGRLVAEVADTSIVPAAGDDVYAPTAADIGVYSHYRVAGREFFYDQHGKLALVRLECVEASS
jgi:hypothetical protein